MNSRLETNFFPSKSTKNRINFDFHGRKWEDWCQPRRKRRYRNFRMLSTDFSARFPREISHNRHEEMRERQRAKVPPFLEPLRARYIYIYWKYYSVNDIKRIKDELTRYRIHSSKNYSHLNIIERLKKL